MEDRRNSSIVQKQPGAKKKGEGGTVSVFISLCVCVVFVTAQEEEPLEGGLAASLYFSP